MSRRIAIWAIVILLNAVICSQARAQVEPVPITDVNPASNILEAYVTADEKDIVIGATTVKAMVYKDCAPAGVCPPGAGAIPGPQIEAKVGDLVIIHFRNDLDTESASIHWHGIELDNDSDGTAVTQDAVKPGQSYTYQFRMFRPGVYWYHSHFLPGSATFAGMYGSIIIENNIEASLQGTVLPAAADTHTLVLSDIEFDPTTGKVGKPFMGSTRSINELVALCQQDADAGGGTPNRGACGGPANLPGNTVLVNGAIPHLAQRIIVPSGKRIRLRLINAAITRHFKLILGNGADNNLYRVGGEGGLLDKIQLDGGTKGTWDTLYNPGEITLGSGERADVVFVPSGINGNIIQIVGDRTSGSFMLSAGLPQFYDIAFFEIQGTSTDSTDHPTAVGGPILDGTAEDIENIKDDPFVQLQDPAPFGGSSNETIRITNVRPTPQVMLPSIDGFSAMLDTNAGNGDFLDAIMDPGMRPQTSRYARVGDTLQLEVRNETAAVHPFHLHGFSMQPVAMKLNDGTLLYTFDYDEFIDSQDVYGNQTFVFRIRLDDRGKTCDTSSAPSTGPKLAPCTPSPIGGAIGRWLFHCHIFHHAGLGMMGELVALDGDADGDTVLNTADNCPNNANLDQADADSDFIGDVCDNCAATANQDQANADGDTKGDVCDNCPAAANSDQADGDFDGIGDACDPDLNDGPNGDSDADGVLNNVDNCPTTANSNQANNDGDALGDLCDPDDDNDGVLDGADNCPFTANTDQLNTDGDGLGDVCDPDDDNDGVPDGADNCPFSANADQANNDGDALGDVCDPDDDNDGVLDGADNCPFAANADQVDGDGDGIGNICDSNLNDGPTGDSDGDGVVNNVDNCPTTANANQANNDGDGLGDLCDPDDDNDGVPDGADNCPFAANADQADGDGDLIGNACDPNLNDGPTGDSDGDGILNNADNCPTTANANQANNDGDALGDVCDPDDDNDGVLDTADNCPFTANPDQADGDGDGIGTACDPNPNDGPAFDSDGDGVLNNVDNCPTTANANQANNDGDALGDVCDPDDDNDGVLDGADNCPFTANADQADGDGDGIGNLCDSNLNDGPTGDLDGDGVRNNADNCPTTANANQANNDGDALGDVCDPDDDNDGVPDGADNCPLIANADQADGDGDGIGNACDSNLNNGPTGDLDGDGVVNNVDNCPATANPTQQDSDGDGTGDACESDMTISKTHTGNFSQGQVGATYQITVTNSGLSPSSGVVTMSDTVPIGLTPTGPAGVVNGWTCAINGQTLTCTRSDALAGGASYPVINLTVNVANPAPLSVTNTATVSGGGEAITNNNAASDPTTINCSSNFALNNTSPLMISRFRENGPRGPQDEFVEIFNPTDQSHTVASGNCNGGGYGVYASAGNRTTSNTATLVCYIPNGTVIPAGGYYLCTGVTYSLGNLGRNGGEAGATAVGDSPIGCGSTCGANIPDDAGLALVNKAAPTLSGGFGIVEFGDVFYDKVGFGPYVGIPTPGYPSLAHTYCEGGAAGCLKPVGDASTGAACANPSGLFPVAPAPPACYGLAGQYEFLRRQTLFDAIQGTLHQDTNNNGNDFILVAPNPATNMGQGITGVAGVTGVLGAAGPYNRNAPPDMPAVKLTRSPFDGTDQLGPRNMERRYIPDPTVVDPANNPLGTLTLRFRYTNNSGLPINGMRFEVDNLSTLCGPKSPTPASSTVGTGDARNVGSSPSCGAGSLTAILKALNSTAEVLVDSGGTAQFVNGTVMEDLSVGAAPGAGPLSPNGGGIDSTFIINPSSANASVGDGVTGGVGNFATTMGIGGPTKELRLQVKFGVVRSGRFILLLVPMGKNTPAP